MLDDSKYVCISCECNAKELYKEYSPTVLKLSTCNKCGKVVDKYIEYDPMIVIIDLVLLNREAYRHVLFNTHCEFYWKLLVILELMEAYWEFSCNSKLPSSIHSPTILLDKFYTGDLDYYKTLFKVICGNVLFLLVAFCLTFLRELYICDNIRLQLVNKQFATQLFIKVAKCLTLSSFGIFLFLPSLIWEKFGTGEYHFLFVIVYTALSQLVAYTVCCKSLKTWSILVILCAYAIKIKTTYIFSLMLNN